MYDGKIGCGCSIPMSSILENTAVRREIVEQVKIDKKKFLSGDLVEATKFAFVVDPEYFKDKIYNELGLKIVDIDGDSKLLAKLSETGQDAKGILKDKDGNPIIFSYVELLIIITLNKERINKTHFNFV